jgi:F420H(2)-dependent quinone reductase
MLLTYLRIHRSVLRTIAGRLGGRLDGMRVLLLETTGRTSGQPRSAGLFFLEEGGSSCAAGSHSGQDRDPAWAANLRAHAKVARAGRSFLTFELRPEGS